MFMTGVLCTVCGAQVFSRSNEKLSHSNEQLFPSNEKVSRSNENIFLF